MLRTCYTAWPQHAGCRPPGACSTATQHARWRQTASAAAAAPGGSQLTIGFTYTKDQALLSGVAVYLAAAPTPAPAPAPGAPRRCTARRPPRHGVLAPGGRTTPCVLDVRAMLLNACHPRIFCQAAPRSVLPEVPARSE
jgi:hypothetical protein